MREKKAKKLLEHVKHTYDKIADEFSRTRQFPGKEFSLFEPYIKPNLTIADLGCGNGRLFPFLKEKTKNQLHYLGIDNNENFINIAQKKYPHQKFIIGNQLKIPMKGQSTDILFNIRSFHHIPSKKLREKSLHEMKKILKDKGILIISVWNLWQKKYWKELLLAVLRSIITLGTYEYNDTFISWGKKEKRYYHAFTQKELIKLIEKTGFKILESHNKYHDFIIIARK